MKYSKDEIMQFVQEEDVKFIRLAFCDVTGRPKNVSIMPTELERAFTYGIAIDASAIAEDMKVKKALDLVKANAKISKPRKPAAKKAAEDTEATEA